MFQERKAKPHRPDTPTRITLVLLSKIFNWRDALVIVQPRTLVRWHRQGFRLFWRWKSRLGRPPIPVELRQPIREMAMSNPSWGEERIANELMLKLGIRVSPRYCTKIYAQKPTRTPTRRSTLVGLCTQKRPLPFWPAITVSSLPQRSECSMSFIVIEHQTRRVVHCNVTTNPTATWTLQQLREAIPSHHVYRFLIDDRDDLFSPQRDQSISHMGLRVLRSHSRSPKAYSVCERVIGTLRRECLDFFIPTTESHPRCITANRVTHYNRDRPHSSSGPGIPDPPSDLPVSPQIHRHRIPNHLKVWPALSWGDYIMNMD